MKKINFITLITLLLFGVSTSFAQTEEVVKNYTFNFDDMDAIGEIDPGSTSYYVTYVHNFAPAGWGHIVDYSPNSGYYGDTYVTYRFESTSGTNNSGALQATSQDIKDYDTGTTNSLYDLLVTPLVNGRVTLQAKKVSNWSDDTQDVKFYKVTYSDGEFHKGEQLNLDTAKVLTSDFSTLTLTLTEPTYVGIRANYAIIDDFSAEQATIIKKPSLNLKNVINRNGEYNDADADGNVTLKYDIVVSNTGLSDLNPNDDNYSLSLTRGKNGDTIVTTPVEIPLAAGTTDTIHFSASVPATTLGADEFDAWIKENITGKTLLASKVKAITHNPIMEITKENDFDPLSGTYSLGSSQKTITRNLEIHNNGAATLNISQISVTSPYSANLTAPVAIEPHKTKILPVTLPDNEPGTYNGTLKINGNAGEYRVDLVGTIVDSTAWFVDFEDLNPSYNTTYPKGSYAETSAGNSQPDWQIYAIDNILGLTDNKNAIQNVTYERSTKYISPLLEFRNGDIVSFDAAKREPSLYNFINRSFLKVYYSTDRKNWTLAYTITADSTANADAHFPDEYKSDGSYYSSPVFEFAHYDINTIPTGKYYIGFEAGYVQLDNILAAHVANVNHDLIFMGSSIPSEGEVNHAISASAKIHNFNVKDEAADSYTTKLYFGDEPVGEAASTDIHSNEDKQFEFNVTPHKAGTLPAYIKLAFNDSTIYVTDTTYINISKESYSSDKQIGEINSSSTAPFTTYNKHSEGAVIYPASLLGLPSGTKIKTISLKGYVSKDITTDLQLWIANTESSSVTTASSDFTLNDVADTANMSKIYDGNYNLKQVGSTSSYSDNLLSSGEIINITLAKPFIYDGSNILIAAKCDVQSGWATVRFEADNNYMNNAIERDNDNLNYATWETVALPVIYLGVEGEAPVVSGKVTSEGTPVANIPVTFKSGDVLYSDTTDNEGNYSVSIMQTDKKYTMSVSGIGYEPYTETNISIEQNMTKNIDLAKATGLFIKYAAIPSTGTVNSVYTATAEILNDISTDISSSDYTAKLFFGDKLVSEVQARDLAPGKSESYSFVFTPHKEGAYNAYLKISYKGNTYYSDTAEVTISEEEFGGLFTAGDSTMISNQSRQAPWCNWYKQDEGEVLYPKDAIHLEKGAIIKKIFFRGRFLSENSGDETARMYIENTDQRDLSSVPFSPRDTTAMTKIFDGIIHYEQPSVPDSIVNVIQIEIPDGFIYNGGSLRVSFAGNHIGQGDNQINYVADGTRTTYSWSRNTDSGNISEQNWQSQSVLPVMFIIVDSKKKISGIVTAKKTKEAIPNANVTLYGPDDVQYYGSTDANGQYSINIGKSTLTYKAVFTAEGYKSDTISDIKFTDGDVILYDSLSIPYTISGTVSGNDGNGISKAMVTVASGDQVASGVTDISGKYAIEIIDADSIVTVKVSADGYADGADTLSANEFSNANIVLKRLVTVSGLVEGLTDKTSPTPISGASVMIKDSDNNEIATVQTNADGTYSVDNLVEGTYSISFSAEQYVDTTIVVSIGYVDLAIDPVVLRSAVPDGISSITQGESTGLIDIVKDDVVVYSLNGMRITEGEGAAANLPRGTYIIRGKIGKAIKITIK